MQPLVSIILPTYNGAKYIRKSIESCLAQTYTNFELIIVNDCSTDNTPDIVSEFERNDNRIKVLNNQINKKLPRSLNAGFEIASGEFFTWTSDDNYYADNAIEVLVKTLQHNTSTDLVYTDYTIIDDTGKVADQMAFGNINASFIKWKGCGACFLYKKEVHQRNNGYDPSTFLIEDYDFFLRAYLHSSFLYIQRDDLYFYRHHPESLTGTMSDAVFDIQKIVVEKRIPLLLSKLSKKDRILLYRKYTVYYALFKNNPKKISLFLELLYKQSFVQAFITVVYISVKKIIQYFIVITSLFISFLRLVLGLRSKTK